MSTGLIVTHIVLVVIIVAAFIGVISYYSKKSQ